MNHDTMSEGRESQTGWWNYQLFQEYLVISTQWCNVTAIKSVKNFRTPGLDHDEEERKELTNEPIEDHSRSVWDWLYSHTVRKSLCKEVRNGLLSFSYWYGCTRHMRKHVRVSGSMREWTKTCAGACAKIYRRMKNFEACRRQTNPCLHLTACVFHNTVLCLKLTGNDRA